jgi:tetratricopeptide (TPR) repeat protein
MPHRACSSLASKGRRLKSGNKIFAARYADNEPMELPLPTADEWLGLCVEALDDVANPQNGQLVWRLQSRDAKDVHIGLGEYGRAIRAVAAYDFDYDPAMFVKGRFGESAIRSWMGTPYVRLDATCCQRHDDALQADVLDVWLNFYDHLDFGVSGGKRIVAATLRAIETTVATALGPELLRPGQSRFQLASHISERRPLGVPLVDRVGYWLDDRRDKARSNDSQYEGTVRNDDGGSRQAPLISPEVRAKVKDVADKLENELGDSPAGRVLRRFRTKATGRENTAAPTVHHEPWVTEVTFPTESSESGGTGDRGARPGQSPEDMFNYALSLEGWNRDFAAATELHQQVIDSKDPEWAPAAARALGDIRRRQGDLEGAAAAYQFAIDSGHPDHAPRAANELGYLCEDFLKDFRRAEGAYLTAVDSRHPEEAPGAALSLGRLRLHSLNDVDGAAVAFQMAINSGDESVAPAAMYDLGSLHEHYRLDIDEAIAAYQMTIDTGYFAQVPAAAIRLGHLLETERNDAAGAADAYQIAIDSRREHHAPTAAIRLGLLRENRLNDLVGADDAYLIAVESGNTSVGAEAANHLGALRENKLHDYEGARAAYVWAIQSAAQNWAPRAAFHLGVLNETRLGNLDEACDAYRWAINSDHPEWAPRAAANLAKIESSATGGKGATVKTEDQVAKGHTPAAGTSTGPPEAHRPDPQSAPAGAEEKAPKGQRGGSRDRGAIDAGGDNERHLLSSRLSDEDKVRIDEILGSWRDCADWAKRCAGPLFPTANDRESLNDRARSIDYVVAKAACEAERSGRWEGLDPGEQAKRIRTVGDARRTRNIVEHEPARAQVSRLTRAAKVLARHSQLLDSLSPQKLVITEDELSAYLARFADPPGASSSEPPQ